MNSIETPVSMSQEEIAQMQEKLAAFESIGKNPEQLGKLAQKAEAFKLLKTTPEHVSKLLDNEQQEKEINLYRGILSVLAEVVNDEQVDFKRIINLDGLDTAGKGRTIREITKQLNKSFYNVVEFTGVPTEEERFKNNWYKRYSDKFLEGGKQMTYFDRSYQNRATVEPVMNYCSQEQYDWHMENIVEFEKNMTNEGYVIEKILLDITGETQDQRMKDRNSELKRWKISPTDKMAKQMRAVYQHAIYEMLEKTNSDHASWSIVDNNEKWSGVIEVIKIIVNSDPYLEQKVLEKLHSMKKTNKKKFFLIHPDVDSDKDIDDIINEVLVPNKKVVKTARQKNSIDERKAKKEFEENMGRPWTEKDPLVIGKGFDWKNLTGW